MIDKELLDILACPLCKADVKLEGDSLRCVNVKCGCQYSIRNDIPVMMIDEAQRPCPECSSQRDWAGEKGSLICPKCGMTFKYST